MKDVEKLLGQNHCWKGLEGRFTCMVKVPGLLSSSPWISKIGFLILLADMKGLIST